MKQGCSCLKCKKERERIKEYQQLHPIYYSNFYSNTINQCVLPGESVKFHTNGPTNCFIFRLNDSQFNLTLAGTYEILINVYINQDNYDINDLDDIIPILNQNFKLVIKCNDLELQETMMQNNGNYIYGCFLINTDIVNTIISINNPINSNNKINMLYDKDNHVYSHLIIKKIN